MHGVPVLCHIAGCDYGLQTKSAMFARDQCIGAVLRTNHGESLSNARKARFEITCPPVRGGDNSSTRIVHLCRDSAARLRFQRHTTTRGLPKYLQVVQDISYCGLGYGLEISSQTPALSGQRRLSDGSYQTGGLPVLFPKPRLIIFYLSPLDAG